jgi:TATA-binding protein-associated factor
VDALRVLQVAAPALHPAALPAALRLLPALGAALCQPNHALVLAAARALAALAAAHPDAVMPAALRLATPLMAAGGEAAARLGGVVAARELVAALGLRMVPYVQLAVVPLLGRMSDPSPPARAVAARCFASVVALMPLAHGAPPPPGLDAAQEAALRREGGFLQQLLDNRRADDFPLPFALRGATLRRYQQEGINWLAFLRRFGLHGVLADDMGLGALFIVVVIVAAGTCTAAACMLL